MMNFYKAKMTFYWSHKKIILDTCLQAVEIFCLYDCATQPTTAANTKNEYLGLFLFGSIKTFTPLKIYSFNECLCGHENIERMRRGIS
jgi:hypothetical protein